MTETPELPDLLTPAEVARLFRVDPKTVTRWARAGRLSSIRTPGGHRRYYAAEVQALREGDATPPCSEPGSEIPGQPGYRVGTCGHAVAESEWRWGWRTCEHCPSVKAAEPEVTEHA